MSQLLKEFTLGDMVLRYVTDNTKQQVGLVLLPKDKPYNSGIAKNQQIDSLVQIKVAGDVYGAAYAQGDTLRNGETTKRLIYQDQQLLKTKDCTDIITILKDERGYMVSHHVLWNEGDPYIRFYNEFMNQSKEMVTLEMISSFSLGELSPYLEGDGHNQMVVHRIRSRWSQEGRLESIPLEELQLEPAWASHAVRCERFGQIGSMPVNRFFPFLAIEDKQNHVFWGAQLAHAASWQMEIYRKDDGLAISGGLADREFGHWMKQIDVNEQFQTPIGILSVCSADSIDYITKRLTDSAQDSLNQGIEIEQDLPIVFNEYCTTWGCPSHENITAILDKIKDKGFTYFVIDCGWYKEDGVPWDISMGDYEVSPTLFPEGLEKTVLEIKKAGLKPGIWFEIENVGSASRAYHMGEYLLHRDGKILTTEFRRFWDMRDPWVESYLTEKVIGTLKKYEFEYMKIDYNETIGIGCDGAESLGEGLRQNMEATLAFIKKVKKEIPNIVLENCASGGHRLEPQFMSITDMASFSDAHECVEIPIIAANLHRVIQPRQSQIWAVIRKEDSLQRIRYSIVNTFLGRMCISGDVTQLDVSQWSIIEEGISFYKKISKVIKAGQTFHFGSHIMSVRNPEGWQVVIRLGDNGDAYGVIHTFGGHLPEIIEVSLPEGVPTEEYEIYSDHNDVVEIQNGVLTYTTSVNFKALAIYFRKKM